MVRLCCIYRKYTGDEGWCFPTMWPVFEIVLEGISELVEFVVSVLYSAKNDIVSQI